MSDPALATREVWQTLFTVLVWVTQNVLVTLYLCLHPFSIMKCPKFSHPAVSSLRYYRNILPTGNAMIDSWAFACLILQWPDNQLLSVASCTQSSISFYTSDWVTFIQWPNILSPWFAPKQQANLIPSEKCLNERNRSTQVSYWPLWI